LIVLVFHHEERLVGNIPFYLNFSGKLTHPFENAAFQSIFARSVSAD